MLRRHLATIFDECDRVRDALKEWAELLERARDEGIAKSKMGYLEANPVWLDHAVGVFSPMQRTRLDKWPEHRRWLWTIRDHLRHFHDANLAWSEVLADETVLRELNEAIEIYQTRLKSSDEELDRKAEFDRDWMR